MVAMAAKRQYGAVAGRGGSANLEASKEASTDARADGGGSSSAGGSLKSALFNTEDA